MARTRRKTRPIPNCLDTEATGLQELLPYWHIQDGVVFLADGTGEIGFELTLPPASGLDSAGFEALYRAMRSMLNDLGREGRRIRVIYEVVPARYDDVIALYEKGLLAEEEALRAFGNRRLDFLRQLSIGGAFYDYKLYLTIKVGQPRTAGGSTPLTALLSQFLPFLKRKKHVPFLPEEYLEWIERLEFLRTRVIAAIGGAGIDARSLDDQELFALIFRTLNPDKPVPVYQPPVRVQEEVDLEPELLATNLNDRLVRSVIDNRDLDVLRIGSVLHRVYQLVDIPHELAFGALQQALFYVDPPYRAVIDYAPLPRDKTHAILTRTLGDARAMQNLALNNDLEPSVDAEVAIEEARAMQRFLAETGELAFKVSSAVILYGRERESLHQRHNEFLAAAGRELGALLPIEKGVLSPFIAALPFNGTTLSAQKLYVASDGVKYMPWQGAWRIQSPEPRELYVSRWNTPIAFNLFKHPTLPNQHSVVVGAPGSGKSFFVQQRLLEYLKDGQTVVMAVDKDHLSYDGLYKLFAEEGLATKLELGPGSGVTYNPFELPEGATAPDEVHQHFLEAFLTTMVPLDADPATASMELAIIEAAIQQAYDEALDIDTQELRTVTLSDFVRALEQLHHVGTHTPNAEERRLATSLAARFSRWTQGHARGSLFDGPSTFRIDENIKFVYTIINTQENDRQLMSLALLAAANLAWTLSLQSRYPQKIAVFEEAWALINNERSAAFVEEIFRAGRKRQMAAIAISQALQDFTGVHTATILNNASHIIYFRTSDPLEVLQGVMPNVPPALYSQVGGGSGYRRALLWLKGDKQEGDLITVQADPVSYWIFTSNPNDLAKRHALEQELGSFRLAVLVLAGEMGLDEARRIAEINKVAEGARTSA